MTMQLENVQTLTPALSHPLRQRGESDGRVRIIVSLRRTGWGTANTLPNVLPLPGGEGEEFDLIQKDLVQERVWQIPVPELCQLPDRTPAARHPTHAESQA